MTSKVRNEWYQTDSEVVLSLFIKNVTSEQLTVDLQEHSLSLSVTPPTSTSSHISFDLDPLYGAIDPTQSSHRIVGTIKIEVKLRKKVMGIQWAALEREEGMVEGVMQPLQTTRKPTYPTSAKTKTNWDAFNPDADDDAPTGSTDPNAGGDSDVNKLFQTLYAGATDEQKKAMVKSYQESNGTALSTDWDKVKVAKVETSPPDSMVARTWDGKATKASGNNVL